MSHRLRVLGLAGALGTGLTGVPAAAHHLDTVVVTQVATHGLAVTVQVDVTYAGGAGGGVVEWTTGDGGRAAVPDGTTSSGGYLGDAAGTAPFPASRPVSLAVDTSTFRWVRTRPAANVARTTLTFAYARGGSYQISWTACCPARGGSLPVAAEGPAEPLPYHPRGVIEIAGTSAASATVTYRDFVPDRGLWSCQATPWTRDAMAVTCLPPLAPVGLVNTCAVTSVVAESDLSGTAYGESACVTGYPAAALGGPWTGMAAEAQAPRAPVPWTCSAAVALTAATPWRVRCAVNQ